MTGLRARLHRYPQHRLRQAVRRQQRVAVLLERARHADAVAAARGPIDPAPTPLTPRELTRRQSEVLALLLRGSTYPAIAAALGIGRETVRDHVRAVYRALGVGRRRELAELVASGRIPVEVLPERTEGAS